MKTKLKNTSEEWYEYYQENLKVQRINWAQRPTIMDEEKSAVLASLKAWQLGETSEGKNLLAAATKYAQKYNDPVYIDAVKLFIREEQKHGNNLGRYIDLIGEQRIQRDWGDSLFRKIRYYNNSMELWTLAVITVESTAEIFYNSLKNATSCNLLKDICKDILIDEVAHIDFQMQRMAKIFTDKGLVARFLSFYFYKLFYYSTILVVWFAHKKVFKASGDTLWSYVQKMRQKYERTLGGLAIR